MATFLRDVDCPACGHKHSFALPAGDWPVGTPCDYACPQTGAKTSLSLDGPGQDLLFHPQGTILLTPQATDALPP